MSAKIIYVSLVFLVAATTLNCSNQKPTRAPKSTEKKIKEVRRKFERPQRRAASQKIDWDAIKIAEKENIALKETYKQLQANALNIAPKALGAREAEMLKKEFLEQATGIQQDALDAAGSDELVRLQEENKMYSTTNDAMISIINDLLAQEQLKSGRVTSQDLKELEQRQQALEQEEAEEEQLHAV